jgi:hypothetical protein
MNTVAESLRGAAATSNVGSSQAADWKMAAGSHSEPNEMARTEENNRFLTTPEWLLKFIVE